MVNNDRDYIDLKSFNTYYYSNIIENILSFDQDLVGFYSNFKDSYADLSLLKPFDRTNAFQKFCSNIVMQFFLEDMYNYDLKEYEISRHSPPLRRLYAESPLEQYGLDYRFIEFTGDRLPCWVDIEAYHNEIQITGYLADLFDKIGEEIFHKLFSDRSLMQSFNVMMTDFVFSSKKEKKDEDDYYKLFKERGLLRRSNIPKWAKRAVFFRDKGTCCLCKTDVSGFRSLNIKEQYDHIVPLKQGGLNDISNIQLLCSNCNNTKGGDEVITSLKYERWY